MKELLLDPETRRQLWSQLGEIVEGYAEGVGQLPLFHQADAAEIRASLRDWNFDQPADAKLALGYVADQLLKNHLHTSHSAYFGVFNPRSSAMGVIADALVAAFNPQLASWQSAPFAIEAENHVIKLFGSKFGFNYTEGTFTSGGMEANHTALLAALVRRFSDFKNTGVRGFTGEPVIYVSTEAHHSFLKAARLCGLGEAALRLVATDAALRLNPSDLERQINDDLLAKRIPLMIVGTVGTTSAGIIDPIAEVARVAEKHQLWFHVDGAWGAAAIFSSQLRPHLAGIEKADSLTFDAHKWLSVPMGAGLFLTRHQDLLRQVFGVSTAYMPADSEGGALMQPYTQSMQWSRRFIGLKLFLTLAVAGFEGYERVIDRQTRLGEYLRLSLVKSGWLIKNQTPLPVVCFGRHAELTQADADDIAHQIALSGKSWITTTKINGQVVLRAGIANFTTGEKDVDQLVALLDEFKGGKNGR